MPNKLHVMRSCYNVVFIALVQTMKKGGTLCCKSWLCEELKETCFRCSFLHVDHIVCKQYGLSAHKNFYVFMGKISCVCKEKCAIMRTVNYFLKQNSSFQNYITRFLCSTLGRYITFCIVWLQTISGLISLINSN